MENKYAPLDIYLYVWITNMHPLYIKTNIHALSICMYINENKHALTVNENKHASIYIYIYIWTSKFVHSMCVDINNKYASTIHENKYALYMYMGWLPLAGSLNDRSLLQNMVSCIGLFCKRDL